MPMGGFMDYPLCWIDCSTKYPLRLSTSEDWGALMDKLGMNRALRAAILSPAFDNIRGAASCKQWAWEAARMRFEALDHLIDHIARGYERRQGSIVERGGDRGREGRKQPLHQLMAILCSW